MNERLEDLLNRTLARIDAAIAGNHTKDAEQLPNVLLFRISNDIRQVRCAWPLRAVGYGRFVIDWPNDSEFRSQLIDAAYQIERAREKDAKRKA